LPLHKSIIMVVVSRPSLTNARSQQCWLIHQHYSKRDERRSRNVRRAISHPSPLNHGVGLYLVSVASHSGSDIHLCHWMNKRPLYRLGDRPLKTGRVQFTTCWYLQPSCNIISRQAGRQTTLRLMLKAVAWHSSRKRLGLYSRWSPWPVRKLRSVNYLTA